MKKLVKLALLVGAITWASKMISAKKQEWEGLTEAEARAKIESKMPSRIPAEKRSQVADKVVAGLRSKGKLARG